MIWYFWDGFKSFIRTQIDKQNQNLENWQKVIKRAIKTKAKVGQQLFFQVQKIDTHCLCGYQQIKDNKLRDQKDSKAKKIPNNLGANQKSGTNDSKSCQSR